MDTRRGGGRGRGAGGGRGRVTENPKRKRPEGATTEVQNVFGAQGRKQTRNEDELPKTRKKEEKSPSLFMSVIQESNPPQELSATLKSDFQSLSNPFSKSFVDNSRKSRSTARELRQAERTFSPEAFEHFEDIKKIGEQKRKEAEMRINSKKRKERKEEIGLFKPIQNSKVKALQTRQFSYYGTTIESQTHLSLQEKTKKGVKFHEVQANERFFINGNNATTDEIRKFLNGAGKNDKVSSSALLKGIRNEGFNRATSSKIDRESFDIGVQLNILGRFSNLHHESFRPAVSQYMLTQTDSLERAVGLFHNEQFRTGGISHQNTSSEKTPEFNAGNKLSSKGSLVKGTYAGTDIKQSAEYRKVYAMQDSSKGKDNQNTGIFSVQVEKK